MNRLILRLIAVLLLFSQSAFSQKAQEIDSLKKELAKATADTLKVRILLELAMGYQGFMPDSAMQYALVSLNKAEEINDTTGRADALLHIGRLKRDQDLVSDALKDMFEALKLYREIDDKVQIANALNDISIIYATSGDYHKSLDYFQQALVIFRETGDEKGESYALNNIGLIYQELHDDEKAKDYFIQSLKIKEKNNDIYGISRGYTNLGTMAKNNRQWDEALKYLLKADSLYEKSHDLPAKALNFLAISDVMEGKGKRNDARAYAMHALDAATQVKSLSSMSDAAHLLSTLDEKDHNFKSSLKFSKLYAELADSLNNENHRANLEELKAKFDVEEKERQIVLLKKDQELQRALMARKNVITYSLIVGMILLLFISALTYYAYQATKAKKNSLAIKNREIEHQRNDLDRLNKEKDRFFSILSHDLRSPLSSLKGLSHLITNHADALTPEEMKEMRGRIDKSLDNLTDLINNILEWSMTTSQKRKWDMVRINTTDLIQKNISLYQTIAEGKGVNLVYKSQHELFAYADYQAINTVIRNLLSNSIKFSHPNNDVDIAVQQHNGTISISVKDYGVGIPLEVQERLFTITGAVAHGTRNEKGVGLGLTLCMELIKENEGNIQVNSTEGVGSEFIVTIPAYLPQKH